jgi:hypothetical protein
MSQIALTNRERIDALMRFDYTLREADFLNLAALHGGHFLRRQFCQFIGKETGGTAATLVEKVVAKGHGTVVAGCQNARVYHLDSRPFYAALGQEDNRNRRVRPPVVIKNRLMGLDFILDHRGHEYLATEQEKVGYFNGALGIDLADLPVKRFRSPTASDSTCRHFVDKYPIFITTDGSGTSSVTFCFVDEGVVTGARFESYLKEYIRLWSRLGRFELVYVAEPNTPFASAEKTFQRFMSKDQQGFSAGFRTTDLKRLLQHFEHRRLYEGGQTGVFDRATLIRLRNDREEFAGRFFQALYDGWKVRGEEAVREAFLQPGPSAEIKFTSCFLQHNYDVFGSTSKPNAA